MQHSSLWFWFKETIWYEYLCNRKLLNIFFQIVTTSFSIESSLESVRKVRFREYFIHLHAANLTPTQREIKGTQRSLQICMYYMLCIVGIQKYHAHTAYGMLSLCRKYAVYQLEPSFPIFSSEEGRRRADNKIPKPGTRKMKTVNSL